MNFTTERVIADYPAYKIVEPQQRKVWVADDTFALPFETRNHGTLWHFYKLSSVVSYALRTNSCPIEALERAQEHRHVLHFAISLPTMITAERRPQQTVVGLKWGDVIQFEGRRFELRRAPNDNVSLIEVGKVRFVDLKVGDTVKLRGIVETVVASEMVRDGRYRIQFTNDRYQYVSADDMVEFVERAA